jgi:glycerol-3-phosphate dehydrogenase (NAD(P)+)
MPSTETRIIGVAGAGAWGTALALAAARTGHTVRLWARNPLHADGIAATRRNERYLPDVTIPAAIELTSDLADLAATEPLLLVVPAQALRAVTRQLAGYSGRAVICAKGLEQATGLRLSEVLRAELPDAMAAELSGPSFAREVAAGLPAALTLAAERYEDAIALAELLAGPGFRLYPSDDLLGVELGGAIKNVIAIAAGVVEGRGLGENARAALITRGLAEMARLCEALGARRETLMGLSGLGDLLLTATSLTSRNTRFGHELGRGRLPSDLLAPGEALSEGAYTAEAVCRLAARAGVELPISEAVRAVVAGQLSVDEAVTALLTRPLAARE